MNGELNEFYCLFLFVLLIIVLSSIIKRVNFNKTSYHKITGNTFYQTINDKGKNGEYQIYKKLSFYENKKAKFLFNVYIPKNNGETTECDVIMIAPIGIIVIESKNYSGWIFGDERHKTWTQTLPQGRGNSAQKEKFFNPVLQNKGHIDSLKSYIKKDYPVFSIIAFSERCELKKIAIYSDDVQVLKRNQIQIAVANLFHNKMPYLSETEIEELYNLLLPLTQVSEDVKNQHIMDIKNKY